MKLRKTEKSGRSPGRVTCVDKTSVFHAFAFFWSIFDDTAAAFPDLRANHAYADATALWMVQKPRKFGVVATETMFRDILCDVGAGLIGGLGLAHSADIMLIHAVFQPCHGSRPDIAGKSVANPFAMILLPAMMLAWLTQAKENAEMMENATRQRKAVENTTALGTALTRELGGSASTKQAADAVFAT